MKSNLFGEMDDHSIVMWLGQYSGRQAGYYPSLRRLRVAAEAEAARRSIQWWRGFTHYTPPPPSKRMSRAFDSHLVLSE